MIAIESRKMTDQEIYNITRFAEPVFHSENLEWDICLSVNRSGAIWAKKSFDTEQEAEAYIASLKEACK